MKKLFLSNCVFFISLLVFSQAQEGTVSYQKSQQPAAVLELSYAPDVVSAALNDYLSRKGRSKATDLKGFTTYRNTQPVQDDSSNADLYFKIERKSRKEKEISVVSLILTMPREDGISATNMHYMNMEQAKTFLNGLIPVIESYGLELQIKEQNEAVTKSESKYKNLAEDGEDLEKKRTAIEKKIRDNKNDLEMQRSQVDNEKQKLATLVAQRKL